MDSSSAYLHPFNKASIPTGKLFPGNKTSIRGDWLLKLLWVNHSGATQWSKTGEAERGDVLPRRMQGGGGGRG